MTLQSLRGWGVHECMRNLVVLGDVRGVIFASALWFLYYDFLMYNIPPFSPVHIKPLSEMIKLATSR